jgi:protein-disulfide isomerase
VKADLSTVANIATIATCVFVAYVAVGARATRPTPASPIEEVQNVTTPLPRSSVRGDPRARTVVIEFTDFQCPFCGRHARETFPAIQKEFVDTGKIRWAVRQFPLDIHPAAYDAAKAASCAGEQQRYWPMHERLFAIQNELALPTIATAAEDIGLVRSQFDVCMNAPARTVEADKAEARRLGVISTPTFLVGSLDADGNVHVKTKIRGVRDPAVFREVIGNMASLNSE